MTFAEPLHLPSSVLYHICRSKVNLLGDDHIFAHDASKKISIATQLLEQLKYVLSEKILSTAFHTLRLFTHYLELLTIINNIIIIILKAVFLEPEEYN